MELKLQIRGKIFSLCIGYKTAWFTQKWFITIIQEWYYGNNLDPEYAEIMFHS